MALEICPARTEPSPEHVLKDRRGEVKSGVWGGREGERGRGRKRGRGRG